MKIAVNGLPLLTQSGGIGVYTRELLKELVRLDAANAYHVHGFRPQLAAVTAAADVNGWSPAAAGPRKRSPWVQSVLRGGFRMLRNNALGDCLAQLRMRRLRTALERAGVDVYLDPNFFGVCGPSFRTIVTIHDMAYARYPETINPLVYRQLRRELGAHARRADAVLTDSQSSRSDILELLGVSSDKVHVIYPGVARRFVPVDDAALLAGVARRYGLPPRFLLFTGTIEPRKNLSVLIEAFERLCADARFAHCLVLAGPKGWRDPRIAAAVDRCRHKHRILQTGYIADEDLPALYCLGDALILPSLYEGFGLPLLEAMACGTNVIASDVSSCPEVVGDAGVLFDPRSAGELADAVRELLGDAPRRGELRRRGLERARQFNWTQTARGVLAVIQALGPARRGATPLAACGSTPPR